jgi:hypothetical protein
MTEDRKVVCDPPRKPGPVPGADASAGLVDRSRNVGHDQGTGQREEIETSFYGDQNLLQ